MQRDNKDVLETPIMFKDKEIRELKALRERDNKRIELLDLDVVNTADYAHSMQKLA